MPSASSCPAAPDPQPPGGAPSVHTLDSSFLDADAGACTAHLHLIVLNYTLPSIVAQLWPRAATRVCADGGANRLYDQLPAMVPHLDPAAARSSHLPDFIRGDMDSLRPDVRAFYRSHGVPMEDLSADQDTTDLTKCLQFLQARIAASRSSDGAAAGSSDGAAASNGHAAPGDGGLLEAAALPDSAPQHQVLVLGALGGRLDHTLANLNTLLTFPQLRAVLIGDGNLVRLLPRGTSRVTPHPLEGPSCGLVPLAGPAVATSTGLRWNLKNTQMAWRGLLSTSNEITEQQVTVTTDEDLLWITEVRGS